ncbi:MAG: hypothetical protein ACI4TB_06580 [Lachnospiraceae bacterium]
MTSEEMKKMIVKCIFSVPNLTLREWQDLLQSHPNGHSVAISTISGWKNGKQEMSFYYRNILIRVLCDTCEMQEYQQEIRDVILENVGIKPHEKLYAELLEKDYESFLKFVLNELPAKPMDEVDHIWDNIPTAALLELCAKKAEKLQLPCKVEARAESLIMTCRQDAKQEPYRVAVGFLLGTFPIEIVEEKCIRFRRENMDCIISYLFVTIDVTDRLYSKILNEHKILLLQLDETVINNINDYHLLNALADELLQKMRKINLTIEGIYHLLRVQCEENDDKM